MNPVVKPLEGDQIVFQLTDEDKKLASKTRLIGKPAENEIETAMHQMCVMQLITVMLRPPEQRPTAEEERAFKKLAKGKDPFGVGVGGMVDPGWSGLTAEERWLAAKFRAPDFRPVCVSEVITDAMINLNDRDDVTDRQRARLKKLAEVILNTCPVQRTHTQHGTVVDKPMKTREYEDAERRRMEMLDPILNGLDSGADVPFARGVKLIEQAANLFHAGTTTV